MYFDYIEQPFVVPEELSGETARHPVVIVGAGPVGLFVAIALARFGIRSVILEQRSTIAYGSRAICISQRSLDILEKIGVAAPFTAKGYPWSSGTTYYRDRVVLEFDMPQPVRSAHPPMINLQQCYIEQFLYEAACETGLVDIRWHSSLASLDQHDGFVEIKVDTPEGSYTTEAEYLVACDGARSQARRELALRLNGTSYEGRYVIADIRIPGAQQGRRVWFDPPSNPGSTLIMHCQPDDIVRIDYQLDEDQDAEAEIAEQRVHDRVKSHLDWIGETRDWNLEWISLYKAHSRTLDRYVHKNVLFAGDAAHLVPIFGVRGLNSGLEDANNLAWKLAYVLGSNAPQSLLESYSSERVTAAHENMRQAEKSAGFMTPPGKGQRLMRDAVLSLALSQDFARELVNPRQVRPVPYRQKKSQPRSIVAGQPCPNIVVTAVNGGAERDTPLYLLLGLDFTLLVFGEPGAYLSPAETGHLTVLQVASPTKPAEQPAIMDHDGQLSSLLEIGESGGAVLIRPDGYIIDVFALDEGEAMRRELDDWHPSPEKEMM
jgi:3-(3-hydroxy-phenyl)propionate hydroxylase